MNTTRWEEAQQIYDIFRFAVSSAYIINREKEQEKKKIHTSYFPDTLHGTLDNDHSHNDNNTKAFLSSLPCARFYRERKKYFTLRKICYAEKKETVMMIIILTKRRRMRIWFENTLYHQEHQLRSYSPSFYPDISILRYTPWISYDHDRNNNNDMIHCPGKNLEFHQNILRSHFPSIKLLEKGTAQQKRSYLYPWANNSERCDDVLMYFMK